MDKTNCDTLWRKMICLAKCKICIVEMFLAPIVLLVGRTYIALDFWRSGLTKISNLESAKSLFQWEYIPNWEKNAKDVWGMDLSWTVPNAELAAPLSAYAELALPVLLILGLMGRSASAMLFVMALVIEVFVYPGTAQHYYWVIILGMLLVTGPGRLSFDHFVREKTMGETKENLAQRASLLAVFIVLYANYVLRWPVDLWTDAEEYCWCGDPYIWITGVFFILALFPRLLPWIKNKVKKQS